VRDLTNNRQDVNKTARKNSNLGFSIIAGEYQCAFRAAGLWCASAGGSQLVDSDRQR
jgi:hypothetical protein